MILLDVYWTLNLQIKAETLILDGDPKDMICQASEQMHVDLLVVGSRGLGKIKRQSPFFYLFLRLNNIYNFYFLKIIARFLIIIIIIIAFVVYCVQSISRERERLLCASCKMSNPDSEAAQGV